MKKLLSGLTIFICLVGCTPNTDEININRQQAYVAIYRQANNVYETKFSTAQPIKKAGKQYVFGTLLLQNEENEGIHLFDVSNASSPVKLGFLQIPLCTEMAVREGFLYANNYADLVVYDLRATPEPKLVQRIKDVFPPANQDYPPFFDVVFECPDKSKGVVVGWELKNNVEARCRR